MRNENNLTLSEAENLWEKSSMSRFSTVEQRYVLRNMENGKTWAKSAASMRESI